MSIPKCDVALYTLFRKKAIAMKHDELYYALLDWADQHKDIMDAAAKKEDSYTVKYIKFNDDTGSKTFSDMDNEDPFLAAKHFYDSIYRECSVVELWHNPNPILRNIGHNLILVKNEL